MTITTSPLLPSPLPSLNVSVLSWPWDALRDAHEQAEEAERAGLLALRSGDAEACGMAAFDLETALLAKKNREENLANILLEMIRYAARHAHLELWKAITDVLKESVLHEEFKKWLLDRDNGTLKKENWELATWCKELQDRIKALEAKVATDEKPDKEQGREHGRDKAGGCSQDG